MPALDADEQHPPDEQDRPHFASFVLRCWKGESGQVRARLLDVHSGVSHPLADLADLPGLVDRLLAETVQEAAADMDNHS